MDAFAKLSAALQTLIDLEPEVTHLQGNLTDQQYEDLYDLFDKAEQVMIDIEDQLFGTDHEDEDEDEDKDKDFL
jgi:uncharacterized protein YdeI (BOF family)